MGSEDTSFIPDLPSGGPLAVYRKRANFDWKRLRLIFEKEQGLRIKVSGWLSLRKRTCWNIFQQSYVTAYQIAELWLMSLESRKQIDGIIQ